MNGGIDVMRASADKYFQRTTDCCSGVVESGSIIKVGMREGKLIDLTMGSHENLSRLHGANCLKLTA